MSFAAALDHAGRMRHDPAAVTRLAQCALEAQEEALAVPIVDGAACRSVTDPRLWQWSGLLHRALDERISALRAFGKAAALAPQDASIAHGHARTMLEAGMPAVARFEIAHRLAPQDGDVLLGLVAARIAENDHRRALEELDALLVQHPGWIAGHQALGQLRWTAGDRDGFARSLDRALAQAPRDATLWQALVVALIKADQFERALAAIAAARRALGAAIFLDANEAIVLSELGRVAAADARFALLSGLDDVNVAIRHVRHLLRTGRLAPACSLIERWIATSDATKMWPYASLAWRLSGDPRLEWLDGAGALVAVIDLADRLPSPDRLATLLRHLHGARGEHVDQSVRGGTQTDGILLARIEPEIRALRGVIAAATRAYVEGLPTHDPRHPTLRARRDRVPRFSGSWSVRLPSGGYHANHVHPAGWLSSALYVAVPEPAGDDPQAGWLTLGAPQAELALDLAPTRLIEPRPGRLVIFPSTMWHGTLPVASGERLTIAFDVHEPV